jgi:Tfp pilus assembly protein PilN
LRGQNAQKRQLAPQNCYQKIIVINQLNLSSRPFRNRTLPWILAAVLCFVAVFGFLFLFAEYRSVNAKAEAINDSIKQLEPKIKDLKTQAAEIKQALTPEQQKSLLAAHQLVARKRFSWSRLLADLESVMPQATSVSHAAVRDVYQSGDRMVADLEISILSRNYENVMAMINQMGDSGMFQAELRGQDLQKDKGGNLTEYSLSVRYLPRYGVPYETNSTSGVDTAQNQTSQEAR